MYGNETEIGAAVNKKIEEKVISREDMFITSKLWNTFHRPNLVRNSVVASLNNLQLEYLDLYLMHWPMAFKEDTDNLFPTHDNHDPIESDVNFVNTWKAMEELVTEGLVRSIGVSNFNQKQMEHLLKFAIRWPAVLQIECHPYITQSELSHFCKKHNIHITAYSPLGSPNRPNSLTGEPNLFANKSIISLAKRLRQSQAQILIRYQIQLGRSTIPKSITPARIVANIRVFDFHLSQDDMTMLNGLNFNRRFVPMLS